MALLIRGLVLAATFLTVGGGTVPFTARADERLQLHEQEIEAGLIYNFLKYIEWPSPGVSTSVIVCIFGDDPFKNYLQPMAGRTVNQRSISVRNVHDLQAAAACNLLFVTASEKNRWPQLEKFLVGKGVLTVSAFSDFVTSGGMIEFGRKNDRVHVSLNMDAVTAERFRVEERLLKLVTVTRSPGSGGQ